MTENLQAQTLTELKLSPPALNLSVEEVYERVNSKYPGAILMFDPEKAPKDRLYIYTKDDVDTVWNTLEPVLAKNQPDPTGVAKGYLWSLSEDFENYHLGVFLADGSAVEIHVHKPVR